MSDTDQWTIKTGEELNRRIRESDQSIEHDRERGYFLSHTHERVSPLAVAERRVGIERMKEDLQKQQQPQRDYVKEMVDRLEEIEREHPKERRQERDQERER